MNIELIDFYATDGVLNNGYIMKNNSNKILIATHGMDSNCFKKRERIIAETVLKNGIDFLGYNNRGSELVKDIKKKTGEGIKRVLGGTSLEDPVESYYDIKGAILKAVELGYTEIFLQGHSLGSTKVVYTYNKLKEENSELLKYIKGIILLSLVDIPGTLNIYLGNKLDNYIEYAEKLKQEGKQNELMPKEAFIHPVSAKTFLRYARDNEEIDFASYGKDTRLEKINNIDRPLFMRWGNVNEMILQNAEDLVNMINIIIKNPNKDINFIAGADHGYKDRREELAKQIISFSIKNIA